MPGRRVVVFGPAYLDRVLRVDRPLIDPEFGPPLDQSVDGVSEFGESLGLELMDPSGYTIEVELQDDWPGPRGMIRWDRPIREALKAGRRFVRGIAWQDDLGGMGAGYASALKGRLTSALGSETDPTSRVVARKLVEYGVDHDPIRVVEAAADWTLLVTSGEYGDKLPIGFRGCHMRLTPRMFAPKLSEPCDLRVVASLPNSLAARLLFAPEAGLRFFAPTMRNMDDGDCPVSSFAAAIDVLSCNRREWEAMSDPEEVSRLVSIVIVTDGAAGSEIRSTEPNGEPACFHIPAFPRDHAPRDTNRAGEAFASTFVSTLLDSGWIAARRVVEASLIRMASERASAAAALVLDRLDFGFPSNEEIDAALHAGRVS